MLVTGQLVNAGLGVLSGQDGGDANGGAMQTGAPFGGVLKSMVDETNDLQNKASEAVTGLLGGTGVEVHDAMIATQKASMAFELALQVRNKAVGAYQQMMGMQF
ncbi:flagellar hook-basal body complex protein FliE [Granulicella rosea]|uniref:Flagellar hook-basal body complex protein FliE n=1 Tax=Granulicella rosea TaxID=474952 RepID=A0A239EJM9_9BACT|nr:flagellar hook-basal body complex protein FliE [Granulicella rosea]SNS44837.1 flagellar hook-basal body complex protein FliE [Granulicella rosea]